MNRDSNQRGWAFILTITMIFTSMFGGFSFLGINGAVEEAYAEGLTEYTSGAAPGTSGAALTYIITDEDQLRALATTVSSGSGIKYEYTTFILQNELSLTGGAWTPIGTDYSHPFSGTFDGNDHTITGVAIGSSSTPNAIFANVGFFGYTNTSTIKNLGVDVTINSSKAHVQIGGLVGHNIKGTITDCHATGAVTGGEDAYVGGLVGLNIGIGENNGTITNCYTTGNVTGGESAYVGGLVGYNEKGTMKDCHATGDVTGVSSASVGGLVGENNNGSASPNNQTITNCYATGAVTGGDGAKAGGLVGENKGTITNCYATGDVTGENKAFVGSLVGANITDKGINATITNCYATGNVKGGYGEHTYVGGLVGANLGTIIKGYWNSDADQTLSSAAVAIKLGIGNKSGVTTSLPSIAMTNPAFSSTLNANLDALGGGGLYLWEQRAEGNNGYPIFSTILFRASITATCPSPAIGGTGASAAVALVDTGKYEHTSTVWSKNGDVYVAGDIPLAVITLTAKAVYTFDGLLASHITVAGGVVTYDEGQGVSTDNKSVVFTVTYPILIQPSSSGGGKSTADPTVVNTINGIVTEDQFNNAIKATEDGAAVTISSNKTDEVVFPVSGLGALTEKNNGLVVITENGTLTFDSKAVKAMNDQAAGGEIKIALEDVDKTTLTKEQQAKIGDKKVYDLTAMSGDKLISSFDGGKVTVSVPYLVNPGETTDDIGVWYMADDGSLTYIKCSYDSKTKSMTFILDHFSKYIIGYYSLADWVNPFTDVKGGAWYYDAAAYVNIKSLMKGKSLTCFEPEGLMTRGMLVTILGRMEGVDISTYEKSKTFLDVSSSQYYAPYIEWARDNDIVSGVGGGKFAPEQAVTREDMAALITNYLKFKGQGPVGAWAIHLKYSDLNEISSWAGEGVMFATMKGLMKGVGNDSDGNPLFAGQLHSTRAQAAQVIMNLGELLK